MVLSTTPFFEEDLDDLFPTADDSIPQVSAGASSKNGTPVGSSNGTTSSQRDGGVIDLSFPPDTSGIHALSSLSLDDGTDGHAGTGGAGLVQGGTLPMKAALPPNAGHLSSDPVLSFRRSDMFKAKFPVSSSEKTRLLSCRPAGWADAFCSDFHLALDSDPKLWAKVCESFNDVKDFQDLQRFLSCDLNGMPLMFLGVDHDKKIRVIHNVLLAPDSGSIVNLSPSFICLTQEGFDSPPVALVADELVTLLVSTEYPDIPSAQMIFDGCVADCLVSDGSVRPSDVLPDFRLDSSKFEEFSIPEEDATNTDEGEKTRSKKTTDFEFMGLIPIHPSISGELLKVFAHFGFDSNECSPQALASRIFRFLVRRWAKSIGRDKFGKATFVDFSHGVFSGSLPLFRFLWIICHKPNLFDSLVFDVPSKFDAASKLFRRHFPKVFPDLASPIRSKHAPSSGLPPTPHQVPQVPPLGQPPASLVTPSSSTRAAGGVSPDTVYLTQKMTEQLSEVFLTHSNRLAREKEDNKKEIFKNAIHLRNGIVFGQVNPESESLPVAPTELALEIFRQKSTHTLHSLIQARVFRKSANACYILFSQCGVLQKYGLRWKGDDHPSGYSPFSFDPYHSGGPEAHLALDQDIHEHIYECSLRQDNGLSTKDMRDIFTNEKLFCPLKIEEYSQQLRSYYLFSAAIFGDSSFIAAQIHKMVEHFLANSRLYRISQAYDAKFLTQVLFSIDDAIQRFIEDSLESAECLEDISFTGLEYRINQLGYKITARESICRMLPRFFLSAINAKSNKVTPNDDSGSSKKASLNSKDSKKRAVDSSSGDPNPSSSKRVKFDSPKDWCLPPRLKYSKVFTRSVLEKMPTMHVEGEDRPFCNKLFALKSCRSGNDCYFCHADPREHGKGEEVSAFYKKVYAEAKKNQS